MKTNKLDKVLASIATEHHTLSKKYEGKWSMPCMWVNPIPTRQYRHSGTPFPEKVIN